MNMETFDHERRANCPVVSQANRVLGLSFDLARALSRLRRRQRACRRCPDEGSCPLLDQLNSQIDTALQQVADEWGLNL